LTSNGYNNAAFDDYVLGSLNPFSAIFSEREAKVTSYSIEGEILEPLRFSGTVISGTEEPPISVGSPSILDTSSPTELFAGMTTLHSMTLLNSMLLSSQFANAVRAQPFALEVFSDGTLYATDPQFSDIADFMNRMLIQHVGDASKGTAGNGMLDALGLLLPAACCDYR